MPMCKVPTDRNLRTTSFVLLLACALASGCDDDVARVSGLVSIDGAPVDQGVVLFRPADSKGPTAEAAIQNGSYSLSLTPGAKQVLIQGFKITGEVHPWGAGAPSAPVLKPVVPERYYDRSEIVVEIDADTDSLDFTLSSKSATKSLTSH